MKCTETAIGSYSAKSVLSIEDSGLTMSGRASHTCTSNTSIGSKHTQHTDLTFNISLPGAVSYVHERAQHIPGSCFFNTRQHCLRILWSSSLFGCVRLKYLLGWPNQHVGVALSTNPRVIRRCQPSGSCRERPACASSMDSKAAAGLRADRTCWRTSRVWDLGGSGPTRVVLVGYYVACQYWSTSMSFLWF